MLLPQACHSQHQDFVSNLQSFDFPTRPSFGGGSTRPAQSTYSRAGKIRSFERRAGPKGEEKTDFILYKKKNHLYEGFDVEQPVISLYLHFSALFYPWARRLQSLAGYWVIATHILSA